METLTKQEFRKKLQKKVISRQVPESHLSLPLMSGSTPPARAAALRQNVRQTPCRSGLDLPGTSCAM